MNPEQLVEELKKSLGDRLQSVAMYGSAVTGSQTKHYSDINMLIVVTDMNVPTMKSISPVMDRWIRAGNPPPLLFSEEFMSDSQDVFPVEFLDMKSNHRVLLGKDPFKRLKISKSNLRHQIEFELRSKLILLQNGFLHSGGQARKLKDLLGNSLSSFTALFRATLRLKKIPVPSERNKVWSELSQRVDIDVEALESILLLREGKEYPVAALEDLFSRLHASVKNLIQFIDKKK